MTRSELKTNMILIHVGGDVSHVRYTKGVGYYLSCGDRIYCLDNLNEDLTATPDSLLDDVLTIYYPSPEELKEILFAGNEMVPALDALDPIWIYTVPEESDEIPEEEGDVVKSRLKIEAFIEINGEAVDPNNLSREQKSILASLGIINISNESNYDTEEFEGEEY